MNTFLTWMSVSVAVLAAITAVLLAFHFWETITFGKRINAEIEKLNNRLNDTLSVELRKAKSDAVGISMLELAEYFRDKGDFANQWKTYTNALRYLSQGSNDTEYSKNALERVELALCRLANSPLESFEPWGSASTRQMYLDAASVIENKERRNKLLELFYKIPIKQIVF